MNLVPINNIIQATVCLALYKEGAGKTYHLTDSTSVRRVQFMNFSLMNLYKKRPKDIYNGTKQWALIYTSLWAYLGVEKETLDYCT